MDLPRRAIPPILLSQTERLGPIEPLEPNSNGFRKADVKSEEFIAVRFPVR